MDLKAWNLDGIVSGVGLKNFGDQIVTRLRERFPRGRFYGKVKDNAYGGEYDICYGRLGIPLLTIMPQTVHTDDKGSTRVKIFYPLVRKNEAKYLEVIDDFVNDVHSKT